MLFDSEEDISAVSNCFSRGRDFFTSVGKPTISAWSMLLIDEFIKDEKSFFKECSSELSNRVFLADEGSAIDPIFAPPIDIFKSLFSVDKIPREVWISIVFKK